jgi:hypothetical protein
MVDFVGEMSEDFVANSLGFHHNLSFFLLMNAMKISMEHGMNPCRSRSSPRGFMTSLTMGR